MKAEHLLAVDAGTGSARAVLFDTDGRQRAAAAEEWVHQPTPGVPGGQDFDCDRNWSIIARCIRRVLHQAGADPRAVRAVSSTSMREGIVLYDSSGTELWACPNIDSRADREAEMLVDSGDAERIYGIAGDWVSITSPARLRWLARHRPEILSKTAGLGMLSDWVLTRLSSVRVTEASCGSSSGMFDLQSRTWSPSITRSCGLDPAMLPKVVDSGMVIGEVTSTAAAETGLAAGTPVVSGGADTQLALLGLGTRTGEFTVIGGSFWQATMLTETPVTDPEMRLRTLCHVLDDQWMIEAIGFFSGMSLRWFRDSFCRYELEEARRRGLDPYTLMEETAARVPAGAGGTVAIISALMNARRWVHAAPSLLQLDLSSSAGSGPAIGVRAIEEAAGYVVRGHRDIVSNITDAAIDHIVFTAGGAKGSLWPQILADIVGMPVSVPTCIESSALGAAICAGKGVGTYAHLQEPLSSLRDRQKVYAPNPSNVSAYDDLYPRWLELYHRMDQITASGLLQPMWRGAGTHQPIPPTPANTPATNEVTYAR